jgi:Trp operon repressor
MNMNFDELNIEEIKTGYTHDSATGQYRCLHCNAIFEAGEIYPRDGRFFEAYRAIRIHIEQDHSNLFTQLLTSESKYNTLTEKQKELFALLQEGFTDQTIATKLGISASTVRHQKFSFREKAKQAKLYLAIYELATEKPGTDKDNILSIHEGAKMVDDRYITTQEESDKIIASVFDSLSPLKLKIFSAKEKKKIVTLRKIIEEFEKGKIYPEKEVNTILKSIYDDYPTLRRYLIEYGFMDRSKDCKEYWVK